MEKRYQPSRRRLEKARREGNTSKSQYLSQAAGLLVGGATLFYLIEISWVDNKILLEYLWDEGFRDPVAAARLVLSALAKYLLILLVPIVAGGVLVELWQIGFSIESSLLLPALKRVDPSSGSKKIFDGLRDIWLVALKLLALLLMFFWVFRGIYTSLSVEAIVAPLVGGEFVKAKVWRTFGYGMLVLCGLAALDYGLRWRRWFQQVGMTVQDLRDEHREEEGDPMIKGSRRAQHEALLREDIVLRVRSSRVIVVEKNVTS